MTASPTPQTSLYEKVLEDEALEECLEQRQALKERVSEARRKYKEADDVAKGKIETLDLGQDAPARVGRFVLTRRSTKARSVAFETAPGVRTQISLIPDV
jgi:hypothetical protein